MAAIYILVGISLLVAGGFLISFLRAVKEGQFEDTHAPAIRMLSNDELTVSQEKEK